MVWKGTRILIPETRNRCAHGIDKLVACVNTLTALALVSALSSSIHRQRGKVAREGGEWSTSFIPLNVCNNTKLCFEKMGAHFYRTVDIKNMCYLSLYPI